MWLGHDSFKENHPQKSLLIPVQKRNLYNNYNQTFLFHDVGLLRLKKDIQFHFYLRPACVNVEKDFDETAVVATDWHHQQENISILEHSQCNNHFRLREILDNEQFCVKLRNNCKFNTGTPLQVRHPYVDNMYSIVGLLTFRKDCLRGESIVAYTRVSPFADWIESVAFK